MSRAIANLLALAAAEIGAAETPGRPNRGPRVDTYHRECGSALGQPWCGIFLVALFKWAKIPLTAKPWLLASAAAWFDDPARKVDPDAVRPGDVFGVPFGTGGQIRHVGLVERVTGDTLTTIEGNTTLNGSREGTMVLRRQRHKKGLFFARWTP